MEKSDATTETTESRQERGATIARRTLLGVVGVSAIGGLTAGVLGMTGQGASSGTIAGATPSATASHLATHSTVAAATSTPVATMDHDAQAEAAVKAFPAKTTARVLGSCSQRS